MKVFRGNDKNEKYVFLKQILIYNFSIYLATQKCVVTILQINPMYWLQCVCRKITRQHSINCFVYIVLYL